MTMPLFVAAPTRKSKVNGIDPSLLLNFMFPVLISELYERAGLIMVA